MRARAVGTAQDLEPEFQPVCGKLPVSRDGNLFFILEILSQQNKKAPDKDPGLCSFFFVAD
jgi:hypothetical protein